jgi:hypothetical protein
MKRKILDWKFFANMAAAIAGIIIPVYLWQSDFSSHSLELRLRSTTSLQPLSDIQELQVFLNGKKLESPYLSSYELVNTGSKSILSSDFETPIELIAKAGLKVVSAQVTGTNPNSIPVKITFDEQRAAIAPFLSNPKDTITFSIITSGERPIFERHARIAGVKEIAYEDSSIRESSYWLAIFQMLTAALLVCLNSIYLPTAFSGPTLTVRKRLSLFTGVSCLIGSTTAFAGFLELDSLPDMVKYGVTTFACVAGMAIGMVTLDNLLRLEKIRDQPPS